MGLSICRRWVEGKDDKELYVIYTCAARQTSSSSFSTSRMAGRWALAARNNQVNIQEHQPRIICINGTIEEWLPQEIDLNDEHGRAILKRLLVFKMKESVMGETGKQKWEDKLDQKKAEADKRRAERKARRVA